MQDTRHSMSTDALLPLTLALLPDAGGGLIQLLSDGRCLALQDAVALPADGLARWRGAAWRAAATAGQAPRWGAELAAALLGPALRQALAQHPGGWLNLQLDQALADLPWELAQPDADDGRPLDQRFTVVRQLLSPSVPAAWRASAARASGLGGPAAQPGAAPAAAGLATGAARPAAPQADILHLRADAPQLADPARLARLPRPPRLLVAEGLPARRVPALAAAATSAGFSLLALDGPAPAARAAWQAALAEGLPFGNAAQAARAAARAAGEPGADAWFYGDGWQRPMSPEAGHHPAANPTPQADDDVRQVTILSCDLVDSTGLMHRLGDEEYSERLTHYHRRVALIAQQHAGRADDPQGDDGFMCYFGYPVAHEDAAAQALRAGLALSRAFDDLGLQVRIGISTGRVVIRDGQPVGAAVHHAARLQSAAGAGGVLAGAATRQIAGERFEMAAVEPPLRLKGFDDGAPVYRVQRERPAMGTERFDARVQLTPFIGREAELQQVRRHWQAALAGSRQALLLYGDAGIGKSRLVHEFRRGLLGQGHRTLECRCAPEHSGSAFQPLIELLRRRLRIDEGDEPATQIARLRQLDVATGGPGADDAVALLGALLSLPPEVLPPLPGGGSAERRRQLTMELLLRVSQGLPELAAVCMIVEDVQWIDPSTRALLQRLIAGPPQQRVMLLLTLRGASAEEAGFAVPAMRLGGLAPEAALALLQGASGGSAPLDAGLAHWLAGRADGVPLFIEESARMAAALALRQPAGDISGTLREAVPATLQDLLMARLDQLPRAKRAAQLGSALGRSFDQALIAAVNAHQGSPIQLPALDQELAALAQASLLTMTGDGDQRQYAFQHALVRDAAHQSLLERDRRRLHAAIAAVLQQRFGALCESQPARLALHLGQAALAVEALAAWERAAHHAAQRSAHAEAIGHLEQALALLAQQPESAERDQTELRLQLLLAGPLIATAGYGADRVEAVYGRALALCQRTGDQASLAKVRLGQQGWYFMRGDFVRAERIAHEVTASLGAAPPPLARVRATWTQANIQFHQGQVPQAVALMAQCLADYSRLGHHPGAVQDPGVMCLCYSALGLWEMGQPDQALHSARQAVDLAEGLDHRFSIGAAHGYLAVTHYFRGEAEPGQRAAQRAIEVSEEGGFAVWLTHARMLRGRLLAEQGALEAGLADMQQAQTAWAASGAVVALPFYGVLQAEGLALAGRHDEALAQVLQAQALIERHGERYHEPEVLRLVGELMLQTGRPAAEAELWLQRALDCAQRLQLYGMALRCACALARLWAARGEAPRAQALLAPALARLAEGHDTRDQRQARALLSSVAAH